MPSPLIVPRHSADDPPIQYSALKAPCQLDLPVASYAREDIGDGFVVHHLYVKCTDVQSNLLPLDANPREPARSGGQVEKMQDSLARRPKDFVKLNNGITLICDAVSASGGRSSLTFGESQGVCNGGHTYFSIVTAPPPLSPDALVHVEAIELPEALDGDQKRKYASDISQARNNNTQLKLRSQADFLGYYDWFKEFLSDPQFVSWHENDSDAKPGAINAELLVRFLSALDTDQYYHPVYHPNPADRHRTPVQSSGGPHSAWFHKMDDHVRNGRHGLPYLGELAALGDDLFEIRDKISLSLRLPSAGGSNLGQFRRTALYQEQMGETTPTHGGTAPNLRALLTVPGTDGCALAPTLEVLLIGLFRTNIWLSYDSNNRVTLVGWYKEPKQLWDQRAGDVLTAISGDYHDQGNDIIALIRIRSPYTNDLLSMVATAPPSDPDVIYDAWKGHRYVKESLPANVTHYLVTGAGGGFFELAPGTTSPNGAFLYRKVKNGTVRDLWTP
jgi:hypothetical protein